MMKNIWISILYIKSGKDCTNRSELKSGKMCTNRPELILTVHKKIDGSEIVITLVKIEYKKIIISKRVIII